MSKTILICGHGPGISDAVARKFANEGFAVALVARNGERVAAAATALREAGHAAQGFACDLGDPAAVTKMVADARAALGPIAVIHWNVYKGAAGDLTTCSADELRGVFDVGVVGLVTAVQAALPDLRAQDKDQAAVLITGGGFAFYSPEVDRMVTQWNTAGLAVTKAAQHKLTGLLHQRLAGDGIYVGSVVVLGLVKGTAFDSGNAALDPNDIAGAFWDLYRARKDVSVNFGGGG